MQIVAVCWQIGAFFMINLCLVVIATQFSETKRRETERMLAERARRRHRSQSSNSTIASSGGGLDVGGLYVEIFRYVEHLASRARRRLARLFRRLRHRYAVAHPAAGAGDVGGAERPRALVDSSSWGCRGHRRRRRRHRDLDPRPSDTGDSSPRLRVEQADPAPPQPPPTHVVGTGRTVSEACDVDAMPSPASPSPRKTKFMTVANSELLPISNTGSWRCITFTILFV